MIGALRLCSVIIRHHNRLKQIDFGNAKRLESVIPADPLAQAAAHHVLKVLALQPRQLFGEEGDALAPGARHAGDVGAPEEALRAERIEDAVQAVLDVAVRIALRGIVRRAGRLQRDVRQFRQRHQFVEMDEGLGVLAVPVQPAVIDDHLHVRMALGDLAKLLQEQPAHHRDRQPFLLDRRPQPVDRAVIQPFLLLLRSETPSAGPSCPAGCASHGSACGCPGSAAETGP